MSKIRVKQGGLAFMINDGKTLSVLALDDRKHGDVIVELPNQIIKLKTGELIVMPSPAASCTQGSWSADLIPLRNAAPFKLSDGSNAVISEFSIPSAISQIAVLRNLKNANDSHSKSVYLRLLKNATILHAIGARKGPYKIGKLPQLEEQPKQTLLSTVSVK